MKNRKSIKNINDLYAQLGAIVVEMLQREDCPSTIELRSVMVNTDSKTPSTARGSFVAFLSVLPDLKPGPAIR